MSNHVTITGNMGREAEMRFLPSGRAVLGFSLADTPRRRNDDGTWEDAGDTLWADVSVWGDEAEDLAERMANFKGRVTVTGRLGVRKYEGKDGTERQSITINAHSVAMHARKRATGNVPGFNTDSARRSGNGYAPAGGSQADPWATDGEAPF